MQVKVTPSGFMDKDTDVSYVNQGNYTDANNIRHRQTDGGNFGGVMPIKGNALKSTIPGYTSGQKRYRFYVDISDLVSGELASHEANLTISFVYSGSGAIPLTYYGTANYAGTSISGIITDIQNFIKTSMQTGGVITALPDITFSVAPPGGYVGNTAYFDMYWTGQDFTVVVDNTQGTYAKIYLLDEYLTSSGNFNIVGSEQIGDDLFLFLASDAMVGDYSLVSEIGVLYSTDNDSTFTYTRLIRSKKLGFSKNRRIESQSEKTIDQISFYLTDDQNKPRVIYLKYANKRVLDGLLFPQGGRYELENISVETCLFFPAPTSYLDDIEVVDNAGALKAGNKRYSGRFLSEDLVPTDFLYPTNPINIFNAELDKPHLITGNTSDVITGKAVRLTLKNIPINIYKYFELVAIEYAGESFTSKIVQRFSIPLNVSQIQLEHTDRGQDNIQLGSNELVAITQKYIAAKSLKIFDNRMTLSNLVEESDLDLSAWAQTFKHQIKRKQIPFIGYLQDPKSQNISYNLNEYINPENVLNNTSYMYNDTYRFGVQVQWKETGKWSAPYWVDDIRIDTSTSNVIGGSLRRVAPTFTDANITESFANGNDVYVYYVEFSNIDLNVVNSVTNKPIKDLITAFRFVRSERIPEVLSTGLFFMGAAFTVGSTEVHPYFNSLDTTPSRDNYPHSYTRKGVGPIGSPSDQWITSTDRSDYLFFYSPDYYFNKEGSKYELNSNDQIKILGVPGTANMRMFESDAVYFSTYLELDGNIGTPTNNGFYSWSPDDHVFLDDGQRKSLSSKIVYAGSIEFDPVPVSPATSAGTYTKKICRSVNVFKMPISLYSYSEWAASGRNSKNNGYFYGQLFRDLGGNEKYPINKELSEYHSTGHLYVLPSNITTTITQDVFGGDVFNQKTFMLLRMGGQMSPSGVGGAGFLVGLYSQNTFNTQMFNYTEWDGTENGSGYAYPQYTDRQTTGSQSTFYTFTGSSNPSDVCARGTIGTGLARYMQQWLAVSNNNTYEKSYNYKDGTIIEQGFDTNKTIISDLPSRITWSAKKILNSPIDNYRIFKPLDFVDLDLTLGEISHHEIVNNNFYTFQERSMQRQYFRDPSAISGTGSDIVIGSGSIMASRGQEISNIGTSKKWSIIKGKTKSGKESVYWFNDRLQKIMRFGEDGARLISERGFISYLTNNAKFLSNENHPLTGKGVHGVWNDRYNEAVFTFKYNDGISNKSFTLVYDEMKNGFVSFHGYYPNIFLSYNNTFFSTNPSAQNQMYLHDAGVEATFYGVAQDANIEMVMNYDPNVSKNFEALQIASEQKPYAANFTTKNHVSYLVQNDFELREDLYYSTIKNDSTGTNINSGNTSRLWGRWIKIKINLKSSSVGQKLINAIVKFRPMARLYNT